MDQMTVRSRAYQIILTRKAKKGKLSTRAGEQWRMDRTANELMTKNSIAICMAGAVIALFTSCASKESAREPLRPGSGIAEFRQIADNATKALQTALSSQDVVAAQSNHCSPAALAAFNDAVQRLQVESLQVRARSQAILTRGDAYFEQWDETLKRVKDPEVRTLAEKNRSLLQQHFQQVKRSSEEARAIFNPFLSGLRTLRNSLESDPGCLKTQANWELLAATRDGGRQLLQKLAGIRDELGSMQALLTPTRRS
jgi:hypothetical protein